MTRCRDLHYLHSVVDIGLLDIYGQLRTAVESKKHPEESKRNLYVRLVLCGNQAILNAQRSLSIPSELTEHWGKQSPQGP